MELVHSEAHTGGASVTDISRIFVPRPPPPFSPCPKKGKGKKENLLQVPCFPLPRNSRNQGMNCFVCMFYHRDKGRMVQHVVQALPSQEQSPTFL